MEIEECAVHFARRIMELEAQCDQLKEEKINLKEEVMEAKGKEEEMIEKCAKMKGRYGKLKEESDSEKSKWREEEENLKEICRQVGVEKKKLEIDLEAARRRMELAQKLMDKGLLEGSNEALNTHNRRLETTFEAQMAKVKEGFDSERRKWRVEEEKIREECRQLNVEKRKLEIDLKEAKRRIAEGGDDVAEKLKTAEAEIKGLKSLLEETDGSIMALLAKNEAIQRQNRRFEMDFHAKMAMEAKKHKVEDKNLELTRKIEVLERWKGKMEAEYCKLKEDSKNEVEKIFNVNKAFEAEKKRLENANTKINELVKWIDVLERDKEAEKMAMEEEGKNKVLELTHRIEVLEREKREIEAEVCRAKKEKSEEIERIQNKMMALEVEKRTREDEGTRRIEVLKNEMEAKVSQAKQDKSEGIQMILNEKRVVKEDYEKKILELVDRNDILERDKQGFEAEITKRDEVIKVLAQENNRLKGVEMKINRLTLKSMDVVQLSQHAHLTNNVVVLGTPLLNEGQNSAGVAHSSELNGSINHDAENSDAQYEDEITHRHACKRKRPISKWEVDQDLLAAFDVDSELCLRAICALYRQHQRLGHSTDTSLSDEGIAFAEYLMSEDPEGRKTKKMVAKLDKIDLDAVSKCINIAKRDYKQVFEIYKSKEDPVFLS